LSIKVFVVTVKCVGAHWKGFGDVRLGAFAILVAKTGKQGTTRHGSLESFGFWNLSIFWGGLIMGRVCQIRVLIRFRARRYGKA